MIVHLVQLFVFSFIVVLGSRKEHKLSIDERRQKIERNSRPIKIREPRRYKKANNEYQQYPQDRIQYKVRVRDKEEEEILAKAIRHKTVPVVFVFLAHGSRGENLAYTLYNIELATLNNDVVVITDDKGFPVKSDVIHGHTLEVLPVKAFNDLSEEFKRIYTYQEYPEYSYAHPQQQNWERANFLRWLILCSYMVKTWTPRVFFADGDVSLYYNMDQAFTYKAEMGCEGAINVESQLRQFQWTGAGESSLWTIQGIINFSKFLFIMYNRYPTNYVRLVLDKKSSSSSPFVCDMTLLFLWWYINKEHLIPTRNHSIESWYEVGLPWHGRNAHKKRNDDIRDTIMRNNFINR